MFLMCFNASRVVLKSSVLGLRCVTSNFGVDHAWAVLEENLKEHQCDANDVRDFIYNCFQESREQLGKVLSYLYAVRDEDDYKSLE